MGVQERTCKKLSEQCVPNTLPAGDGASMLFGGALSVTCALRDASRGGFDYKGTDRRETVSHSHSLAIDTAAFHCLLFLGSTFRFLVPVGLFPPRCRDVVDLFACCFRVSTSFHRRLESGRPLEQAQPTQREPPRRTGSAGTETHTRHIVQQFIVVRVPGYPCLQLCGLPKQRSCARVMS
jgi:hypothetical protein